MKLRLIIALANIFGLASRAAKQGSGVMVTGRAILKLAPDAVKTLSADRKVILISGTNGKTTTTSLIFHALSTSTPVVSNFTGANLFAGLACALSKNQSAPVAVLEVDEMVMPWAIAQTKPRLIVLLNLGRDQLDRLSEVRAVAQKWKEAFAVLPAHCVVLADADDPFVTWASRDCINVIWFTSSASGHIDASTCPECGIVLVWSEDGDIYQCRCGFRKPNPEWILRGNELSGPGNQKILVEIAIPGKAALGNAARAIVAGKLFGIELDVSLNAIRKISTVGGRFAALKIGKTNFRLLLSKNPASWRETLATSADGPEAVALVVNANTQDGKDTSWLWDVDFSPLAHRRVVATGERRLDLSARLTVAGITHHLCADENEAAKYFGAVDADIIASYTAFYRLSKQVKSR